MKKSKLLIALSILGLIFVSVGDNSAFGQAKVELKKEIVKVNYIDATEAASILNAYTSAHGRIQLQRRRNTLIIEDQPDFMAKLLSILKEIDKKPLDLQFTVDIILGSASTEGMGSSTDLITSDPLINELRSMLKYKYFKRLDTSLIKVQDNSFSSQRIGGDGITLLFRLEPRHIREQGKDMFQVELRLQHHRGYTPQPDGKAIVDTLISTTLSVKSGEKSVVGVSKLNGGDKALILILQGEVIK